MTQYFPWGLAEAWFDVGDDWSNNYHSSKGIMSKADAAASLPTTLAQRIYVGVQRNEDDVSVDEFSRYELEMLRDDQEFALYRGRHPRHLSQVLVLAPVAEQPTPASLKRLEHEYSLAAELDAAWAARPLALARHEGRLMLVLEDLGGEPLDRALGRPLELTRFLSLAIGIAAALGQVHRRGLIHKDIKPANVLVDALGTVRLTGFGIASRLPRERQLPLPPEIIAGTFAYMAPEQTGRMNRSIDARSDLYSLGVTFYEMLTGNLPFDAADPLEWVHCHLARQAVPPGELVRDLPEALSGIIMKLLAKSAEERYQTAAGLEADLRRCLAEWESHGRIDPFPLGAHDASDQLLIPEKLYGREREIDALLAAFDSVVADGTTELVLVSGYSGVGKSSVVRELHKALVPPRGLFASGTFDQYKRDVPYATLAHAFRSLVRPILGQSEAELGRWQDAIQQAVGPNGQLIVDLIPELELVIGKQPPVPEVPPQDVQNRFQMVFRRFINVFAREEHPLVLFLNDLQWVDAATLDLLAYLVTEPEVRNLLLVGAYSDNEVRQSHPLMRMLEAVRKAEARVHEIQLTPLALDDIVRLVSDTLHWDRERAQPLAQLVHEKTAGNPFFAIQFIAALAEENLIAFDPDTASWTCDLARIRAKGFTDNVVDLMVDKLHRLPATTREALKQLACLGNRAETATLHMVYEASEEETHAALWEAVREGLVVRLNGAYSFLHDRVQEAAYALIPEGERAAAHLRVGRLLAAQTASEKLEERIFDIVNQFNRGAELITVQEERERVAELNLIAGKRAKAATAYASALKYFAAGRKLLNEDCWEQRYALVFALALGRAECEFLSGDLAAAEERLSKLSLRAANLVDRAAVTCVRVQLYMTSGQCDRAVEVSFDYLRQLGYVWSAHPTDEEVQQEYERMLLQIGSRPVEALFDLPLMTDPDWLATMDVLLEALPPASFTDENLVGVILFRMATCSLENGNCDASCYAYAFLHNFLGARFADYRTGFQFGQLSFDLMEKRGLERFRARVYMRFGSGIIPWARQLSASREWIRRAFEIARETGDITYAVYCCKNMITNFLAAGDPLDDVQREAENYLAFAQKARSGLGVMMITGQLNLIRALRGLAPGLDLEQNLENNPQLALPACWYWIRMLQAHFLAADYTSAIGAGEKAQKNLWMSAAYFEAAEYHFYSALARAAICDSAPTDQRPQHLEALVAHHKLLAVWAGHCPENFENREALVAAEIARLEGRDLDAMRLFEVAIRSAHEHGFVQNEGLANELAARFHVARGFETIAHAYLRNARYCYVQWGADGKVRDLDRLHPYLREEPSPVRPTATVGTPVEDLDLATVVKVSQAVSGEIVLEKLIHRLMIIAVEHSGAERGLLILSRGDELHIMAEATTSRDTVEVRLRQTVMTPADLPESVLHYVIRTQESVILEDASAPNQFSTDEYIGQKHSRSILCLPLVKQAVLLGVLYLENSLTPYAFTPDRLAVLRLLASQAAISLENAGLYADLQASEDRLRLVINSIPAIVGTASSRGTIDFINERWQEYTGLTSSGGFNDAWIGVIHPDDFGGMLDAWRSAVQAGHPFEYQARMQNVNGDYRWFVYRGMPLRNEHGIIVKWYVAAHDIDDQRRAEERLRQDEQELRRLVDSVPYLLSTLGTDGNPRNVNRETLEYLGLSIEDLVNVGDPRAKVYHPEDLGAVRDTLQRAFSNGTGEDVEARMRRHDGQYRWYLIHYEPLHDENGHIIRWHVNGSDIEDRKRAEERVLEENLALREEIDKTLMFEEIVGASAVLQAVLDNVSKVAGTDSTVLITGETGTGKELIARAIHKRSQRAAHAFVCVNCASIPPSLIASELFGHEKGSFTGATQRRLGRFELADGGTIFLDEIGDLPL